MPLLERAAALESLTAGLDGVAGAVVRVVGEAGVGKTALLRDWSRALPVPVWRGACDPLQRPRQLGPLLDVAPALGPAVVAAASGSESRADVFRAVLAALTERRGVLIVEDVHWADETTRDLLTFLIRRIETTRAVLVLSHRDDPQSRRALHGVLGASSSVGARIVRLEPLSLASVRAMVGSRSVDADRLLQVTGGNPFFVTECLATAEVPGATPDTVVDAVAARVAAMDEPAQRCLAAFSVHPGPIPPPLAHSLAAGDAGAADICVEHGLLVAGPTGLTFRHELSRLAVLDAVLPGRRRLLHLRALAHFAAAHSEPTWAAFHAAEAGDPDGILRFAAEAAARAAALGAARAAAGHFAAAVRHADRLPIPDRADLFRRTGNAEQAIGNSRAAIGRLEQAVALYREAGDELHEAEVRSELAAPLAHSGRQDDAVESARAAVRLLEPHGPSASLAMAYARLAGMHMLAREFAATGEFAGRALMLATSLDRPDLACHVLIQGGVARLMAGDESGLADLVRGTDLARDLELPETVLLGLRQLGSGGGEVRRYELAVPALVEAIEYGEQRELSVDYDRAWLARCRLETGGWDEAERLAETVLAEPDGADIAHFVALCVQGRLRARGARPGAWLALDRALGIARRTGHLQRLWPVACARAEAAWIHGHLETELPLLTEVAALAQRLDYPWAIGELAYWLCRAGAIDVAPQRSAPAWRSMTSDTPTAVAAAWDELGCPYESALALLGSSEPADLRSAFVRFDELGAVALLPGLAERIRAAGGAVPARTSRAARANAFHLTARQLEIAELVAAGHTNGEIAAALHLAEKTVEHHVSAILAKVGARSRRELRTVQLSDPGA